MGGWIERLLLERTEGARWALMALALGGLALVVVLTCAGCGGPAQTARAVVNSGAVVLVEVDERTAVAYRDAAAAALAASGSLAEYRAAMEPYDAIEEALRIAAGALDVLSALVDGWEAGGAARWGDAARAALDAFEGVLRVLRIAGVTAPDALLSFLGSIVDVEG